jgi:hemolysin D
MKSGRAVAVRATRRARDELAFLPAALEIAETPPSPIGRAISITIMLLFCFAIAWASIGKLDIVATAPGKIVPSGRTKVVQPFETGIVRAIHVQDGSVVKAGDVLIELDPTIDDADRDHLASDLIAAQLDVARLQAAVASGDDPLAAFSPPPEAPANLVATQRQLLLSEDAEQRAKLASLDRQRTQHEGERDAYAATVQKLEATIPILQQRVDIRKYLADRGYGSKITYLETLSDLTQQQKDEPVEESHLHEAEAALQAMDETRAETVSEYRRTRLGELEAAEQKVADTSQDLVKAKERARLQRLTAPVDGVVQQLSVHTLGGVVTPAQTLLEVVPDASRLEIEAMVSNRDVGFIHPGQEAAIKVDTFTFTKYGLIRGKVLGVSADAMPMPNGAADATAQRDPDSGSLPTQDLVYTARVSLDRADMRIDGADVGLSPGMTVTVEIKTGSRRVISYIASPLLRFSQEALRER